MRLIHFSDTHLGFSEFHRIDETTGVNLRELDAYRAFDRVIDAALEKSPDLVIHAGDLFHTPRPSNRAIACALEGFRKLRNAGIPVVVCAGNHETPRLAASGSIFRALEIMDVHAAYGSSPAVFKVGECSVTALPHMATAELLEQALDQIAPDPEARFNVLTLHGGVRGTGVGATMGEFNEIVIPRSLLEGLDGFDYMALGHYHRSLEVTPRAWYSGSTERFHLNEAGYDKGYLDVDLDGGTHGFVSIETREIVRLPGIDCAGLDGGGVMEALERVLSEAAPLDGKILHLGLLNIPLPLWTELDRSVLRKMTEEALHFHLDPSFADTETGRAGQAAIGPLPVEFAAFIKNVDLQGFDREKMRGLAEGYLREE